MLWSTWNGFCSFPVAEDALPGNPVGGVQRPPPERHTPEALRGEGTSELLLSSVAAARAGARDPRPERDRAVVVTLLVSGIRTAELLGLRPGDLAGAPGDQRLHVLGKGDAERGVPVEAALADVLQTDLTSRRARIRGRRRCRWTPRCSWTPPDGC